MICCSFLHGVATRLMLGGFVALIWNILSVSSSSSTHRGSGTRRPNCPLQTKFESERAALQQQVRDQSAALAASGALLRDDSEIDHCTDNAVQVEIAVHLHRTPSNPYFFESSISDMPLCDAIFEIHIRE
jgi:hypothetical protein